MKKQLLAALLALSGTSANAAFIEYKNLGTFTTPSLNESGVLATGSADINVLNFNGLGIVGGFTDNMVDGGEFISFDFANSAATDVVLSFFGIGNINGDSVFGDGFFSAYAADGSFLGTQAILRPPSRFDVSSLFGGAALSSFTFTAGNDAFRIGSLSFESVPATSVPEPSSIATLVSGMIGLAATRKKHRVCTLRYPRPAVQ